MAERYWVGGSGNWSDDTNHWATIDGGAPGAGNKPTAADNAHFTALSNLTAYTVTIDAAAVCLDLKFDAAPSVSGTITFAGSATMAISGSLLMLTGMTVSYTGAFTFNATSTGKTLTFNSTAPTLNGGVAFTFNGVGGGWTLQDNLLLAANGAGNGIDLINGNLDTNGKTITCGFFRARIANSGRVLTLGASVITLNSTSGGNFIDMVASGLTFSGASSTINMSSNANFAGGGLTFGTLSWANAALVSIFGANTFTNLTVIGSVTSTLTLLANQTVTGTFKYLGNSITNRLLIQSDTLGTARTITAAVIDAASDFCDFQDITGAGTAAPFATGTSLGNCLGNSGITFTVAQTNYWLHTNDATSKQWSSAARWFLATNGGGGAGRVPLPQDNAIFDANSFPHSGSTVNCDMPRVGKDITFTALTNSPAVDFSINGNSPANSIYGSLTLNSGMTLALTSAMAWTWLARSPATITSAGKSFQNSSNFNGIGGTWTLQDAMIHTNNSTGSNLNSGTFDANGFNVTWPARFTAASGTTVKLGSGTWFLDGFKATLLAWNISSGATIVPGTSTLKCDCTGRNAISSFSGGGKTYNNIWITGNPPDFRFGTSDSFADFKADAGSIIRVSTGITITAATWTLNGRASATTDARCGKMFGEVGCYFATPSAAANQITGDIDVRVAVRLDDYTPAVRVQLIGKTANSGVNEAYSFYVTVSGNLEFYAGYGFKTSSVATGLTDGSFKWLRVTRSASTGDVKFYMSDDGVTWTQLGTTQTDTIGAINAGTRAVEIGTYSESNWSLFGNVYRAQIYNGIAGSLAVDFDPRRWSSGDTFTASTGEVWTRNGTAQFTGDNMVTFAGVTDAGYTLAQSGSAQDWKYVSARRATVTAAKVTAHYSMDGGSNTNWTFTAARYWVGGTGNWSSTGQWSLSSGGATGAAVPTATEDVEFDNQSNATAYTATVDATSNCNRLSFGAAPATSGTVTFAGSAVLTVSGSLLLLSGMAYSYTANMTFNATSAGKTITSNAVAYRGGWAFNGVGGVWTLQDAVVGTGGVGGASINVLAGDFEANGNNISISNFVISGSSTKVVNLSGITVTVTGNGNSWLSTATGTFTITAPASLIISPAGAMSSTFDSVTTYNNISLTAVPGANAIPGGFTCSNLTITGSARVDGVVGFSGNTTVTGTLTIAANSSINRLLIDSCNVFGQTTLGTAATITCSNPPVLLNVDFMDITGAGAGGTWAGTSIGNCLGNSGITFTPSATQYWKTTTSGSKNWSTAANWFLATNGGGGAGRVPLPQDDVVFDANSIGAASTTITSDMPRIGRSVTITGVTNSPVLSSGIENALYGSLTQGAGFTRTNLGNPTFRARSAVTLTSGGVSFTSNINIYAPGGSVTLQDALTLSTTSLALRVDEGTFNANNFNVTTGGVIGRVSQASPSTSAIIMGSGTWTLSGTDVISGAVWDCNKANLTVTPGTSTIKFTDATSAVKTFDGGGKTYNNLWLSGAGTGSYKLIGSNNFNSFKDDGSSAHSILLTSSTTTIAQSWLLGGTLGAVHTLGTVSGSGTATISKSGGGVTNMDYMSISRITGLQANTFYVGANSTNGGNNTNLIFTAPPVNSISDGAAVVLTAKKGGVSGSQIIETSGYVTLTGHKGGQIAAFITDGAGFVVSSIKGGYSSLSASGGAALSSSGQRGASSGASVSGGAGMIVIGHEGEEHSFHVTAGGAITAGGCKNAFGVVSIIGGLTVTVGGRRFTYPAIRTSYINTDVEDRFIIGSGATDDTFISTGF